MGSLSSMFVVCLWFIQVVQVTSKDFDVLSISSAAYLSAQTYCDKSYYFERTYDEYIADFVPVMSLNNGAGLIGVSINSESIFVALHGDDSLMISLLSETDSSELTEYLPCNGCQIHRGLYIAEVSDIVDIMNEVNRLQSLYPTFKVVLTGHGIGGGLATLIAVDLTISGIKNIHLITFGAPKVGNQQFAAFVALTVPNAIRMTHERDPIPHLPIDTNFQHSPGEWYEDVHDIVRSCHGIYDPNCYMKWEIDQVDITDHMHYLEQSMVCDNPMYQVYEGYGAELAWHHRWKFGAGGHFDLGPIHEHEKHDWHVNVEDSTTSSTTNTAENELIDLGYSGNDKDKVRFGVIQISGNISIGAQVADGEALDGVHVSIKCGGGRDNVETALVGSINGVFRCGGGSGSGDNEKEDVQLAFPGENHLLPDGTELLPGADGHTGALHNNTVPVVPVLGLGQGLDNQQSMHTEGSSESTQHDGNHVSDLTTKTWVCFSVMMLALLISMAVAIWSLCYPPISASRRMTMTSGGTRHEYQSLVDVKDAPPVPRYDGRQGFMVFEDRIQQRVVVSNTIKPLHSTEGFYAVV